MRNIININENWTFLKDTTDIGAACGEVINLPHSWNAIDGQDGGNDYFRGSCLYSKKLSKASLPAADLYYIEFRGTNSSADLYVNGEYMPAGTYTKANLPAMAPSGDTGALVALRGRTGAFMVVR